MITFEVKKPGEPSFTDRKSSILWEDFDIQQGLTKEVDTCTFSVDKSTSVTYKPGVGDEIQIKQDADKVFAGFIVRTSEKQDRSGKLFYSCDAKDYTYILDQKLVNKTYTGQTEAQIIADIITNFAGPGVTGTNVVGTSTVALIAFNNIAPSAAIQKLADIYGRDWYVDYNKDIHYFTKESLAAPFGLTDTNDKYVFSSLEIQADITQLRNSVIVEGGEAISASTFFDVYVGDSIQHTFKASWRYATPISATINGVAKTIGIEGIADFTTADILYNINSFTFRVNPATPVPSGQQIVFGGKYYYTVVAKVQDPVSIALYGTREFYIQDKNINDKDVAKARAKAEIAAYGTPLLEGSFDTDSPGLRPGQQINITSASRGYSADFIIQGVTVKLRTPLTFTWSVKLITIKSFELIDLLSQILESGRQDPGANQQIFVITLVARGVKVARTIASRNFTPIWVTGDYWPTPSYALDDQRVCGTDVGCMTT